MRPVATVFNSRVQIFTSSQKVLLDSSVIRQYPETEGQSALAAWGMAMVKIQVSRIADIKQQSNGEQRGLSLRT